MILAPLSRPFRRLRNAMTFPSGFTLIELSVVLVIIGLIMFAGIAAWSTIVAGQRITATRAEMENIKRCLINRVVYSEAFPTWDLTGMDCATPRSQFDVEHCLCGRTDAWGNAIRYVSGLQNATLGSEHGLGEDGDLHYIVENIPQGRFPADVIRPASSQAIISAGEPPIDSVAFILVSYGSDRQPDPDSADPNETYGPLFPAVNQPSNKMDPALPPDFSNTRNDLFLVVTSYELASMLRR